jgi:hypothetical protein
VVALASSRRFFFAFAATATKMKSWLMPQPVALVFFD